MKYRYTTIKDIADALGISKSTVSRALKGDDSNVSKETKEKVIKKANEMNYRRNEFAINFRTRSSKTIGIVVPEMVTPFYMNFITTAQNRLNEHGYRVILALSDENPEIERINLEMFSDYRVEGIMISSCHNKSNLNIYRDLIDRKIPLVFFDRTISDLPASMVKVDDYIKSFFMVEHLIYNKRKHIIHLAGPNYIQNAKDRKRGYIDALNKFNLKYDSRYIIQTGVDDEAGEKVAEKIIKEEIPCDAIFCFTEMQALGVQRYLQKHGMIIPQDIAISCMSGTGLSTLVHPTVTAVEQPVNEMALMAVNLILNQIEKSMITNETVELKSKMVIRNSTENNN